MEWGCSYSCQAYICQCFLFRFGFLSSTSILQCTTLLLSLCSWIFLGLHIWFKDCYMDTVTFISNRFLEGAETFYGCLEVHTHSAVQFTTLRGRGSFLPSCLRLSCDSVNKAGCVPTFCRRAAMTQRQHGNSKAMFSSMWACAFNRCLLLG